MSDVLNDAPSRAKAPDVRVWVVIGSTGEYSDRSEWLTRAFLTEEEAKDFVATLQKRRAQLGEPHPEWERREDITEAMREVDPGYSEDYTGTRWYVAPVGLAGL